jgi:hypothetical protein
MATDVKLKDYILYKYKERIKEKKDSLYYMLSIISSGNRGCCSSAVPIREIGLSGMCGIHATCSVVSCVSVYSEEGLCPVSAEKQAVQ